MKKIKKSSIFNFCVIILSLSMILYFTFSKDGLADLHLNINSFGSFWLIIAFLCMFVYWTLDALIVYLYLKEEYPNFKFRYSIHATMVGQFYSTITPFASGGQPLQVYTMSKYGVDGGKSSSVLLQKFLVYQWCVMFYSTAAVILKYRLFKSELNNFAFLGIIGFSVQALVIVALIFFSHNKKATKAITMWVYRVLNRLKFIKDAEGKAEKLENQISMFYKSNKNANKNPKMMAAVALITAVQITSLMIIPYFLYLSFGLEGSNVVDITSANAFVYMISAFVPLPGASGASEGSFYLFFNMFFNSATIKPALVLWRTITYYFVMLVSMLFIRIKTEKKDSKLLTDINRIADKIPPKYTSKSESIEWKKIKESKKYIS